MLRAERGSPSLGLSVVHHCRPIPHGGPARGVIVEPLYYAYEILDLAGQEFLSYHWHPAGLSHVTEPHLHLSSRLRPVEVASTGRVPHELSLADLHVPTGRVELADVVRLLIRELAVRPLRDDWEAVLSRRDTVTDAEKSD